MPETPGEKKPLFIIRPIQSPMKTIILSLLCILLVAGSGVIAIGEGEEKTVSPSPEPLSRPEDSILANTWTNMNPSTHPGARSGHAMAYDSESDRVILFGGYYFQIHESPGIQ
jgi:hypothetical protein